MQLSQIKLIFLSLASALVVVVLSGCSNPNDIFPLKVGHEWRYSARNHLGQFLHAVKVTREVPTSIGKGFELQGSMGDSVVCWDGTILRGVVLAGSRYNPPIPLLDGSKKEAKLSWKGKVYAGGKTQEATAEIAQSEAEWTSDMRRKATGTTLTLKTAEKTFKVVTTYVRGIGPVSQNQHVSVGKNESFELGIDHLSGP